MAGGKPLSIDEILSLAKDFVGSVELGGHASMNNRDGHGAVFYYKFCSLLTPCKPPRMQDSR